MSSLQRLNGALGAVVPDADLEHIDDVRFLALHAALLEHQVLFFREQHLTEGGHLALAERFGAPMGNPIAQHLGRAEVPATILEDTPDRRPTADSWHTDMSWCEHPPKVAILCALDIPEYGGDTLWADLHGAYEQLSPTMQSMLDGLTVRHTPLPGFWDDISSRFGVTGDDLVELRTAFPGAEHPLVRAHPDTARKALYLSGASTTFHSIVGLHPDESNLLVGWLGTRIENPNLQVRWSWRPGDVAIFDERCTSHRALADHFPQHRRMRVRTVKG